MKKISFIASRYKESENDDMERCIRHYLGDYDTRLIIYDKDVERSSTYKMVPNIGREAYAWFDYVIETWENPDDFYVFIHPCSFQERPDKFQKLIHLCENVRTMISTGQNYCGNPGHVFRFNNTYSKKIPWSGNTDANIAATKSQVFLTTEFENIGEWWRSRTGKNIPANNEFTVHGFCAASFKNLHSWGLEFWKDVFDDVVKGGANGEIAHFVERMMSTIAKGKNE